MIPVIAAIVGAVLLIFALARTVFRDGPFRSSHESQFLNHQRTSNGTYHGYFYSRLIR